MLIDTVQSRAADLRTEAGKLTGTITTAINTFDGMNMAKREDGQNMARRNGGAVLPPDVVGQA
jgi:hypothetical protein